MFRWDEKGMFFFARELLFSKRSCSAAIASWKDFRTTAPTYFVMGNPLLTVPQVFGTLSIDSMTLMLQLPARLDRKSALIQ